jgi:hypothetical protein
MAFQFLQRLYAFFNGFSIFLNGFPIFLNGFPLSEKSKKIYLWQQVYKRSPFKLRISRYLLPKLCNRHSLPELHNRHSLPELRNCHLLPELCNRYNACISPNSGYHQYPVVRILFLIKELPYCGLAVIVIIFSLICNIRRHCQDLCRRKQSIPTAHMAKKRICATDLL